MNWPGILLQVAPKAAPAVLEAFGFAETVFSDFQLNTPRRQAHFLAQAHHETGGFRLLEENLNYSDKGLLATFPRHFTDLEAAKPYARQPEKIANRVYSARMGNNSPGDGWNYRGRGLFQLTGRENYRKFGALAQIPLEKQPELALSSRYLLVIALHYWNSRSLSKLADEDDLRTVTYRVNGGFNGLEDRAAKLVIWKGALNA